MGEFDHIVPIAPVATSLKSYESLNMSTDERIRNRRTLKTPLLIFGIVMTVFYVGLGTWLLMSPGAFPAISQEFQNIFAVMLILYGIYRGWRSWADLR